MRVQNDRSQILLGSHTYRSKRQREGESRSFDAQRRRKIQKPDQESHETETEGKADNGRIDRQRVGNVCQKGERAHSRHACAQNGWVDRAIYYRPQRHVNCTIAQAQIRRDVSHDCCLVESHTHTRQAVWLSRTHPRKSLDRKKKKLHAMHVIRTTDRLYVCVHCCASS